MKAEKTDKLGTCTYFFYINFLPNKAEWSSSAVASFNYLIGWFDSPVIRFLEFFEPGSQQELSTLMSRWNYQKN